MVLNATLSKSSNGFAHFISHPSGLARWLALFCVASLPFEIVFSIARSQLALKIGPVAYFCHPALGVIIGLSLNFRWSHGRGPLLWALAAYGCGLVASSVIADSQVFFIVSAVSLGPLLMAAVLSADDAFMLDASKAFVVGQSVWAAVFLGLFLWNLSLMMEVEPEIAKFTIGKMLLAARGDENLWSEMLYFKLLGNFNKQANILVVTLILAAFLYVKERLSWQSWAACTAAMAAMTLLLFSRGAFVVLFIVAACLVVTSLWSTKRPLQIRAAIGIAAAGVLSLTTPEWRDYWRNTTTIELRKEMAASALDGSSPYLSSGHLASEQKAAPSEASPPLPRAAGEMEKPSRQGSAVAGPCLAKEPARSVSFFIFGYGLGNYGPSICRAPEAESHNGFVDAWIQGGVIGAAGYLGLFVIGAFAAGRRLWRSRMADTDALFGLAIVGAVALLAQREYAFVYLWVQSAAGFLFATGLAIASTTRYQPAKRPSVA